MAEERNRHIMAMERDSLTEGIRDQKLGMWIGACLFLFLVISALLVALLTKNAWLAGIFLGTASVGAIGLFIKGRNGKS